MVSDSDILCRTGLVSLITLLITTIRAFEFPAAFTSKYFPSLGISGRWLTGSVAQKSSTEVYPTARMAEEYKNALGRITPISLVPTPVAVAMLLIGSQTHHTDCFFPLVLSSWPAHLWQNFRHRVMIRASPN